MNIKINPSVLKGEAFAPPSKSIAHRMLICAGLCDGESHISGISFSEDVLATLDCLAAMGVEYEKGNDCVKIKGVDPKKRKTAIFPCRESGSTLRFFVPVSWLSENECTFTGYGRLMERPMSLYEKISMEKSIIFEKTAEGIYSKGRLTSGEYNLRADISSQFISGLLFALPLCDGDSVINLEGNVESRSYIDLTLSALSLFGVKAYFENSNKLIVPGNQTYKKQNTTVEGDYSNAAFLDAFNLFGSSIKVKGLREASLQGDKIYGEYFSLLKSGSPTLDVKNCPDLAPVLMAVAAGLNGARLTGTERLKIKESDRGAVMAQELSKFGAKISLYENEIEVSKSQLHFPSETLYSHNDHRVVMSLCVLMSRFGGTLEGAQAVKKSYPDFFEVVKSLGLEVTENDN